MYIHARCLVLSDSFCQSDRTKFTGLTFIPMPYLGFMVTRTFTFDQMCYITLFLNARTVRIQSFWSQNFVYLMLKARETFFFSKIRFIKNKKLETFSVFSLSCKVCAVTDRAWNINSTVKTVEVATPTLMHNSYN